MNERLKRRLPLLLSVAGVITALDQWSKFLAIKYLTFSQGSALERFWSPHPIPTAPHVVVDGYWEFLYAENPGAAWSFLSSTDESFRAPFFMLVSVVVAVWIVRVYLRSEERYRLRRLALALVLGGAVGNFIDRVRLHYVIDFIHWHVRDGFDWPVFNVADSAISVGIVFLLIDAFVNDERKEGPRG